MDSGELAAARQELKDLVSSLYDKLDQITEVEDEFELDPNQNIIDNFNSKLQMKCGKCEMQFHKWADIDQHERTHHGPGAGDSRRCEVCDMAFSDWQERDTHMLLLHSIDSSCSAHPQLVSINTALWCCSLCSQHFVDPEHWEKHYGSFHALFMGKRTYSWMVTICDIKGRGIVGASDHCTLLCVLCYEEISYSPDAFHFDTAHGKSQGHIQKVKDFVSETNHLPIKFLKLIGMEQEVPGLFHPHELQSSCCCRTLACEFCGTHKSLSTKFPDGSVVYCNVCEANFKWVTIESGIKHVRSKAHYKALCQYVIRTGVAPAFNMMFKKQGLFIETISYSSRVA